MKSPLKKSSAILLLTVALMLAFPARALVFNVTYDASVTGSTSSAQIQTAFNAAVSYLQPLFTNNITINLTVYWGATGPFSSGIGLGASNTHFVGNNTYAQLTNALRNSRTTLADSNAVASLPANDPIAGNVWWFPRANAKALGITGVGVSANDSSLDGSIGFGTNFNYTFDPANRMVAGRYDFIAIAEHEITEVMGRVVFDLSTTFIPYDLFRFTNSGGRSFNIAAAGTYFSVDNGATVLRYFWTNAAVGDVQDWMPGGPADSCDYSVSSGRKPVLSAVDLTSLDVIGYKLNYVPPQLAGTKSGGNFLLSFTNTPGTTYTLLATTNLLLSVSNWTTLGTITDSLPSQFQFTDIQAATNKMRFYRASLN